MPNRENADNTILISVSDTVVEEIYPKLFGLINRLSVILNENRDDIDVSLLKSSVELLYKSVDELYRREKLVLFPYIVSVANNEGRSIQISAFDWVQNTHIDIINQLKKFKELVYRMILDSGSSHNLLSEFNVVINEFEDTFIFMQVTVEEKIFKRITSSTY